MLDARGGRGARLPQRLSSTHAETLERTSTRQPLEVREVEIGSPRQVGDARIRTVDSPGFDDARRDVVSDPAYRRQSEPHVESVVLQRRLGQRRVDVRSVHVDAVSAGVGYQRLRRVEAHGLCTQQCGAEGGRMVQLEPRRVEDQRCETLRMTFGEAEIGEGCHLLVDPVGDVAGDAMRALHALVEASTELVHTLR